MRLFDHCAWDALDRYLVDGSFWVPWQLPPDPGGVVEEKEPVTDEAKKRVVEMVNLAVGALGIHVSDRGFVGEP